MCERRAAWCGRARWSSRPTATRGARRRGTIAGSFPLRGFMIATEKLSREQLKRALPRHRTYHDYVNNIDFLQRAPDEPRILFGGLTGTMTNDLALMGRRLHARLVATFPELAGVRLSPGVERVLRGDVRPVAAHRRRGRRPLRDGVLLRGPADGNVARAQGRRAHPRAKRPSHGIRAAAVPRRIPVPRKLVADAAGDGVVQLPGSGEHEGVTSRLEFSSANQSTLRRSLRK